MATAHRVKLTEDQRWCRRAARRYARQTVKLLEHYYFSLGHMRLIQIKATNAAHWAFEAHPELREPAK